MNEYQWEVSRHPMPTVHLKWVSTDWLTAFFKMHLFTIIHSFIHSFILAISIAPLQVLYYSEAPLQHRYCIGVSRRSEQATVSKGLAQGPYVVTRAGVEAMTLRLRVIDLTTSHNQLQMNL